MYSNRLLNSRRKSFWHKVKANRARLLMFLPGFLFILVFSYGPMYGLILAFKDFNIGKGILGSPWVGFKHFETFFSSTSALTALFNTLKISLLKL